MGASLNSLRRYRLFLTLLVGPALVIAIIVVLIITLFGGEGETDTTADLTGTPTATAAPGTGGTAQPTTTTPPTLQIQPTQTPVIVDTPTPTVPAEPTETPTPTATPTPTGPIEHTVQDGETLSGIADAYGVALDDIVLFNDFADAEVIIFVGQIIEIPTDPSQLAERLDARPIAVTGVVIPSDGLNVRDQPNTATSTVQYVARAGSQLNLTGVFEDIDGIRWHEVEDGNWVQSQYLELGATAAPVADAPATGTGTGTGGALTGVVIPDDGLNVRNEPNTTTSTVQYVAAGGQQLNLTGEVQEINGIRWHELEDGNWVQGQYLELGGTASATPAATPAATAAPTPTAAATEAATEPPSDDELTAVVVPAGGLNVRPEPRADAEPAYVAPAGTQLQLTGENRVVDGVTWWELEDGNWVQGQFLRFG